MRDFMRGKNKTPRDNEYIEAYLQTHSTTRAAKICGVSRETIARACRRANIELIGKTIDFSSKNGNRPCKITDEQLLKEAKTKNCIEIARMYDMSAERVYRRARKLGLNVNSVGGGGHYRRRQSNIGKTSEYDEGITLKKVRAKYHDVCQICGLMVDDTAMVNGHIKRLYPTIDHIIPLSKGGTHTWENVRLAHMSCNAGKRDKND
jgi:5-methylcytosine-specific restriction endonuclease McrA